MTFRLAKTNQNIKEEPVMQIVEMMQSMSALAALAMILWGSASLKRYLRSIA